MSTPRYATLAVLLSGAFAVGVLFALAPRPARAACADAPTEDITFPTALSPAPDGFVVQGPAPLFVLIAFDGNEVTVPSELTSSLDWGDGSGGPSLTIVNCDGDVYSWPPQQHSHTYTTPGDYVVLWKFSTPSGFPVVIPNVPVLFVHVGTTPPPATPTPVPSTPVPTVAGATPTPAPTLAATAATTAEPTATATAGASPTASASPTATATSTTTVAPTATPTSTPAVPVTGRVEPPSTPEPDSGRPHTFRAVPEVTDVSTDGDVVATNLVLAGVTIWVFFSSVLFNQTMQENRSEMSGWFKRVRVPVARPKLPGIGGRAEAALTWAGVLVGMGLIYGFLEPDFGFNGHSLVLFLSVVIGVGVVGFFYSGLEAWARRRTLASVVQVKAFPLALAVAAVSVVLSRVLGLQPGVVYGFAASCVVLSGNAESRLEGKALAVPITACLCLSVACWLFVGPVREVPVGWLSHLLEGVAVIVFIGGLEGLLINLIPLDVMDGSKIYRWNRRIWVALLLVSAFLFWHVLLNTQRSYFDSLRTASSATVLAGFLLYAAAGIGLWAYFRLRKSRLEREAGAASS